MSRSKLPACKVCGDKFKGDPRVHDYWTPGSHTYQPVPAKKPKPAREPIELTDEDVPY